MLAEVKQGKKSIRIRVYSSSSKLQNITEKFLKSVDLLHKSIIMDIELKKGWRPIAKEVCI
jgi:hypothetical protein